MAVIGSALINRKTLMLKIVEDLPGEELVLAEATLKFIHVLNEQGGIENIMDMIAGLVESGIINLTSTKTGKTWEQTKAIEKKIGHDPMVH